MPNRRERFAGALMGAWVAEALGVGPHWYYDIAQLRKTYGWIEDYVTPRAGHYHDQLKAGDSSQPGYLLELLARSVIAQKGYQQQDFCERLENELFAQIDGSPMVGPGGFTSQSIRETYDKRVRQGLDWADCAGLADTTEAAERVLVLAAFYSDDLAQMMDCVLANTQLTQCDATVVSMTAAFSSILALLVEGAAFDRLLVPQLMQAVKVGRLPFHGRPASSQKQLKPGELAGPDALLSAAYMVEAVDDPEISIEPAWKASIVYGMPCAIYHILPSCYYLAARHRTDFEAAVLAAINGGGQNQARAMLVGALVGAQVGLRGIPQRWIDALTRNAVYSDLIEQLNQLRD